MSGAEVPLAIAAIGGTGLSVYGQIDAASAQADAARRNAAIKRVQADELLQREQINESIIRDQSQRQQLRFGAQFAATGREGAGLGGILQIRKDTEETIQNSRRDAEFKANMLRAGADIETDLASDQITASIISGFGTVLSGAARAYTLYQGPSSKPRSLPEVTS